MPEFILNDKPEAEQTECAFTFGFIEALFFTETSPAYDSVEWLTAECEKAQEEGQVDGTLPGDVGYTDLHPDSLARIRAFCKAFQRDNAELLSEAYARDGYSEEQAGRDLWFTSQGHGVGFWSRQELEDNSPEYEELTATMRAASNSGDNESWDKAFRERSQLTSESIGEKLSNAARYKEAHTWFDGTHVHVEI